MKIESKPELSLLKELCSVTVKIAKNNIEANKGMKRLQPQHDEVWNKNIEKYKERKEIAERMLEASTLELEEIEKANF
ncbi:MAG: hypothetical protein WC223_10635 [Bacteroidales bacterium]|jgi:hypothetical protein